ncbi:MAG: hypothetical protein JWP29_821 [Rhodoferax sp.]|nr:hypothetical protein [Rhodoferax sp.]
MQPALRKPCSQPRWPADCAASYVRLKCLAAHGCSFNKKANMSILSSIFGKIFHTTPDASAPTAAPTTPVPAPTSTPAVATAPASPPVAAAAQVAPMKEVDVAELLDGMAAKSAEKLNWKTSIVDLMKLLGLDSSITARKELAQELHYTGDTATRLR